MSETQLHIPRGAILFSVDGVAYEFREHLGEGRSGLQLLLARQRTPEGPSGTVLLKYLGAWSGQPGTRLIKARARLEHEVRLATYLEHPGIVRLHGLHKQEGAWYAITEHPAANNLTDLLTLAMENEHCLSPELVLYVGVQVADVLHYAHTRTDEHGRALGIVHRALNPDLLLMDWRGRVRVADFGLALSSLSGRVASTVWGAQGDAYFASPEMLLGGPVDARSDLFNLGLVLLELATGDHLLDVPDGVSEEAKEALAPGERRRVGRALRRAKGANCLDEVEEIIWRAATYSPEELDTLTGPLPRVLGVTIRRLLQRSRTERFQSAEELARTLRDALGTGFGEREAAAELRQLAKEGTERLVQLNTPRPDSGASA